MENNTSFYITFKYDEREDSKKRDKEVREYIKKNIKSAKLERCLNGQGQGIAMRLNEQEKKVFNFARRIGSKFDFIVSVKIKYPRTYQ